MDSIYRLSKHFSANPLHFAFAPGILEELGDHCQKEPAVDVSLRGNDLQGIGNATFAAKIPCPFSLDGDGGIYPAQPLVCRSYFHGEGPEVCKTGIKDPAFVGYYDKYIRDLLDIHAKHNVPADYTLLPLFCLEMLSPEH